MSRGRSLVGVACRSAAPPPHWPRPLPGGREGGTFPSQTLRGGNFFVWDLSDSFSSPRKSGAAGTKTSAIQEEAAEGREGRGEEGGGRGGSGRSHWSPYLSPPHLVTILPGPTDLQTPPTRPPLRPGPGKAHSGLMHQPPHAALHSGGPRSMKHRRNKRE